MLDEILNSRRETLESERSQTSVADLESRCLSAPPVRSLAAALRAPGIGLIAEIKGSSPSKGHIREVVDPAAIAGIYESAGASAVSVLTEPAFFSGKLEYISLVRAAVDLPVLRKDFIFDEYQLLQARAYGADAVLLMSSVINEGELLSALIDRAHDLGLEVLLESSNSVELERALSSAADVVGINNRDFHTLNLDLEVSLRLAPGIKTDRPLISESGIFTRKDVIRLEKAGFNGILVGTAIMAEDDIESKIKELLGKA